MSQEPRPGDLFEVELTLTENQVHTILGGLAWGAHHFEDKGDEEEAQEFWDTRDEVVEQFNSQEATPIDTKEEST